MAYLIGKLKDSQSDDPRRDLELPKAGMCSSWRKEGTKREGFGDAVLATDGEFFLIHCPELSEAEAEVYCMTPPPLAPGAARRWKGMRIDLEKLGYMYKGQRFSKTELDAATEILKAPISEQVIG